jgi:hypothetical protein
MIELLLLIGYLIFDLYCFAWCIWYISHARWALLSISLSLHHSAFRNFAICWCIALTPCLKAIATRCTCPPLLMRSLTSKLHAPHHSIYHCTPLSNSRLTHCHRQFDCLYSVPYCFTASRWFHKPLVL